MNLKNTNKLILIFFLFLFLSCSKTDTIYKKNSEYIISKDEEFENEEKIIGLNYNSKLNFNDFYSRNLNFQWNDSKNLEKNFVISIKNIIKNNINTSNFVVDNTFIFYVDNQSNFLKISLLDGSNIYKVKLDIEIDPDLVLPISIAKYNNFFFAGFANGLVVKFDETGNVLWSLNFNDLLKTPIKILNNQIIVMFNSNKILSIETDKGSVLWEYKYELTKSSSAIGGNILSKKNIIYIIMPNGRLGAIDSIIGERIDLDYLNFIKQKDINNNNYDIDMHIYENLFSIIENKDTIYTYDFNSNDFLLVEEKIFSIKSFDFISNSIFILDNNNMLKAYNVVNKKLFWQVDLSDFLLKEEYIIESFIKDNFVIIFFSKGTILQLNKVNGKIQFDQKLKLSEISFINSFNNNFSFSLKNGKTVFYKQ